jgi:hypothetical protein
LGLVYAEFKHRFTEGLLSKIHFFAASQKIPALMMDIFIWLQAVRFMLETV